MSIIEFLPAVHESFGLILELGEKTKGTVDEILEKLGPSYAAGGNTVIGLL